MGEGPFCKRVSSSIAPPPKPLIASIRGISPARMHNNQNHPLCRRFWVTKNDSPGENSGAVLSRGLTLHNQARQRAEGAMTRGGPDAARGGKPDIGSVAIFGRDGGHDRRSRSKQRRQVSYRGLRILPMNRVNTGGFQPLSFCGRIRSFRRAAGHILGFAGAAAAIATAAALPFIYRPYHAANNKKCRTRNTKRHDNQLCVHVNHLMNGYCA